ncbi:hypothetical protein MKW94_004640 [Papaver nudicaule]|uniref:Uncharacterized protein n=1 Tax=Papaver nudicaule TaxID=74823 RepID=A0AA41SI44_PAPNU|nr:hypothetical protein [Papaver nudicaule]
MEESEKRRERLKAMREEANSEASHNAGTSMPTINLANPLLESSSVPQRPTGIRRFDYYTDPMAAFSGNKRTNNHIYQALPNSFSPPNTQSAPSYPSGPRNFYPIPPPSHQPQRAFESTPPYHNPNNSWRSPVAPPFHGSGNHGPPPGAWNRPGGVDHPPGAWKRPAGAGGYGFSSNSSFGGYRGTGSGRGVSPRPSPSSSPNPYPGGGSNYTFNNRPSPGSGRGGGRGRGSHACTSARERPEMFYSKSMMEDPWKLLKPVARNLVGSEDWLPKSITKKKPRTSESTINLGSQQSLAEFLAASLEEATNDAPNV